MGTILGPKNIPYSYMEPLGLALQGLGSCRNDLGHDRKKCTSGVSRAGSKAAAARFPSLGFRD